MATFKHLEEIGSGGFGIVYKCQRNEDGKIVALKKLQSKDKNAMKRFEREVRIVSSLDHPNIIKIISKRLDDDAYFYTMPLYDHTLRTIMPELTDDERRIAPIFSSMLDALEYAHKQGVIHRDLKPANVLMNDDNDIVVSDFGLGRQFDSLSTRATYTGDFLGTPLYMAPEQINDCKNSDYRADIYGLGRILYEMYTGHITTGFQDNTKLPPAIQLIVSRCTKHDPEERYQSITELKQMWTSIFDTENTQADIRQFALLRANTDINSDEAKQLIDMFAKYILSQDDLHDSLMKTEPDVLNEMYSVDSDFVRRILKDFCDFTADHGWSFDYTDKIGSWCHRVFNILSDTEIRTNLVICVMKVGGSHNRWHVLDIFGAMLKKISAYAEVVVAREKLREIPKYIRETVAPYLQQGTSPALAKLFQKEK